MYQNSHGVYLDGDTGISHECHVYDLSRVPEGLSPDLHISLGFTADGTISVALAVQ